MIHSHIQGLRALMESPPAKTKDASQKVKKYYTKCMKRKKDPKYCSRVAWNIYCSNVNPGYKGCSRFGKKWGRPYSSSTK